MALKTGTRLGPYEITGPIGAGGMGEVYRATDTKLRREVAIKVLPEDVAQDAERLARFRREALLLASLNHPNIATIHGIEETDGSPCLVLELVGGETLAERLVAGALPVEETMRVGQQIAAALEAAHDKGIIHRDLKPANIKVTEDGTVKVLDFGLAKAFDVDPADREATTRSPTVTSGGTRDGVILGTAAYMSPEQARGKALDKRTDIWSFGCVLYECLTARAPFGGETVTDVLSQILQVEPGWTALPERTPPRVRELLQRCLEKDVRNRLRDVGDARIELERCLAADSSAAFQPVGTLGEGPALPARRSSPGVLAAIAVVGAMLGAFLWSQFGPALAPSGAFDRVTRLSIEIPDGVEVEEVFLSPDGRRVVYRARSVADPEDGESVTRLFVRSLDDFEAHPFPDSDRATWAAISPDGRWAAYYTRDRSGGGGKIRKVALAGGPPVTLLDVPTPPGGWMDGEWRPDDTLLISLGGGSRLARLPSDGGEPQTVLELDQAQETSVLLRTVSLPDSDSVLLNVGFVAEGGLRSRIEVVSLETGERRILLDRAYALAYLDGDLVFNQDDTVRAARFDLEKLELAGPERPLVALTGDYSISRTGTLVHVPERETSQRLVLVDRQGVLEPLAELEGSGASPHWSPDGSRLGVILFDPERVQTELWTYEVSRGTFRPLRFREGFVVTPVWTPDGKSLAFSALIGTSGYHVYQRDAEGRGEPRLLIEPGPDEGFFPRSWSPDGSVLAIMHYRVGGGAEDIWLLPAAEGAEPVKFLAGPSSEQNARFSPDGRWIAFDSDESGEREIYVCPYRSGDDRPRARWRVSTGGGKDAVWSPDGDELFFEDARERLMVVSFRPPSTEGETPVLGTPEPLLDLAALELLSSSYDVHPDGSGFVFIQEQMADDAPQSMRIVFNWYQDVTRERNAD